MFNRNKAVINLTQQTESARRIKLAKEARHQFFLAAEIEEEINKVKSYKTLLVKIDLDPVNEKNPLLRSVVIERNTSASASLSPFTIEFPSEYAIAHVLELLHLNNLHPAISELKHYIKNEDDQEVIETLLDLWREQNRDACLSTFIMHEVESLADSISIYADEKIWLLDGPNASPKLLFSDDFSYEGIKKAIKDKHERLIYEKGFEAGRASVLEEANDLPTPSFKCST